MNVKCLDKYTRFDPQLDLYDLTTPSFYYIEEVNMFEFKVQKWHEMRIDLIFKDMYNIEDNAVGVFLEDFDIILYINNIDNAINIKEGLTLMYPSQEDLSKFRRPLSVDDKDKFKVREKLIVPNKSTRKDKTREEFKENDYSLPPVVMESPRAPVRISNGKFSIGGI